MQYPFHNNAKPVLFQFAQDQRRMGTLAEKTLWQHLRNRQQLGKKFRRQHPLGKYVVDFYCHDCSLVVETDGFVHLIDDNPEYDAERTAYLNQLGIRVLRFTNDQVIQDLATVMEQVRNALVQL